MPHKSGALGLPAGVRWVFVNIRLCYYFGPQAWGPWCEGPPLKCMYRSCFQIHSPSTSSGGFDGAKRFNVKPLPASRSCGASSSETVEWTRQRPILFLFVVVVFGVLGPTSRSHTRSSSGRPAERIFGSTTVSALPGSCMIF